eukprot:CAMPEP_0175873262 /NCGR_PEP_ID=MMETSP0107_2-20121207/38212_1 /TAXON_ID=195067 ORGANISM="Goniomonas pacifica, Strain CCMP1869" /NCGR_SAMPLE_ID=MMETSP0107_2 /ASSEMBLY_ACC=CAM_ASM_000203 /LENGTH=92 /DNA_ID=CAMNT_0017191971 /DNA_START=215 /DNA_END=493 /DNA_ORIENTATION=-
MGQRWLLLCGRHPQERSFKRREAKVALQVRSEAHKVWSAAVVQMASNCLSVGHTSGVNLIDLVQTEHEALWWLSGASLHQKAVILRNEISGV